MARLEAHLPFSARLLPTPPPPCPKSGDLKGSSASLRRFSRSWPDTGTERGMSEEEEGGFWESEKEGCGLGLEELDLRACNEDGGESEDKGASLSKHST